MNQVVIEYPRLIPLQDIHPGSLFVFDDHVYLRTATKKDKGVLCIDVATGEAEYRNWMLFPGQVAEDREVTGEGIKEADNRVDEADVGSVFKFYGFSGEYFIKSARFVDAKVHGKRKRVPDPDTVQYFSMSTGLALSDVDADIIDLPVTVYNVRIRVSLSVYPRLKPRACEH